MRMGTFDVATRTAFHFSRADQGYLLCYFFIKIFKNIKKDYKIQIVRQILSHFFFYLDKDRIFNFHMIDLFTSGLTLSGPTFSVVSQARWGGGGGS